VPYKAVLILLLRLGTPRCLNVGTKVASAAISPLLPLLWYLGYLNADRLPVSCHCSHLSSLLFCVGAWRWDVHAHVRQCDDLSGASSPCPSGDGSRLPAPVAETLGAPGTLFYTPGCGSDGVMRPCVLACRAGTWGYMADASRAREDQPEEPVPRGVCRNEPAVGIYGRVHFCPRPWGPVVLGDTMAGLQIQPVLAEYRQECHGCHLRPPP
jgi:hypothetical protein